MQTYGYVRVNGGSEGGQLDDAICSRTVQCEWVAKGQPSIAFLWGLAKGAARAEAEPRPHLHNIIFNIAPRRFDPSKPLPLAGTIYDPRRYRRP